jgi:hypothetical protein
MPRGRPLARTRLWGSLHSNPPRREARRLRAEAHQALEMEIDRAVACGCGRKLSALIEVGLLRFHQDT